MAKKFKHSGTTIKSADPARTAAIAQSQMLMNFKTKFIFSTLLASGLIKFFRN